MRAFQQGLGGERLTTSLTTVPCCGSPGDPSLARKRSVFLGRAARRPHGKQPVHPHRVQVLWEARLHVRTRSFMHVIISTPLIRPTQRIIICFVFCLPETLLPGGFKLPDLFITRNYRKYGPGTAGIIKTKLLCDKRCRRRPKMGPYFGALFLFWGRRQSPEALNFHTVQNPENIFHVPQHKHVLLENNRGTNHVRLFTKQNKLPR